jgi:hypothetical protein
MNAWNGEPATGPKIVTNQISLDQIPLYIHAGTILPLAPEMQYTGEHPWDPITLDIYPRDNQTSHTLLYEDDTSTTAYQQGQFRTTPAAASIDAKSRKLQIEIGPAQGSFDGALPGRTWILRAHHPANWSHNFVPKAIRLNGRKLKNPVRGLKQNASAMPFGDSVGAPDADVFEVTLPATNATSKLQVEITL